MLTQRFLRATLNVFTICALSIALFASCTNSFYHVASVQSEQVKLVNKDFTFESEHLKVVYDLWEEGGRMRFLVFNKTDQPIYIDWTKSFLARNGTRIRYSELPPLARKNALDTVRYTYQGALAEPYRKTARGNLLTEIPPQTFIAIADMPLQQIVLNRHTREKKFMYTQDNSPLRLVHQLAYSFSETLTDSQFIGNSFWVDKIEIVREGGLSRLYGSLEKGKPNALYAVEKRVAAGRAVVITVALSVAAYLYIMNNLFNNFTLGI